MDNCAVSAGTDGFQNRVVVAVVIDRGFRRCAYNGNGAGLGYIGFITLTAMIFDGLLVVCIKKCPLWTPFSYFR